MKMKLRKLMQQAASYVEIVLSAFLLIVIMFLAGKFIVESVLGICLLYTSVKMLCTHTPGTVIEVLLFAISRQMIVGHVSGFEVLAGVAAIAGLFATHKYLYAKSFGTEEKEEKQDK